MIQRMIASLSFEKSCEKIRKNFKNLLQFEKKYDIISESVNMAP